MFGKFTINTMYNEPAPLVLLKLYFSSGASPKCTYVQYSFSNHRNATFLCLWLQQIHPAIRIKWF